MRVWARSSSRHGPRIPRVGWPRSGRSRNSSERPAVSARGVRGSRARVSDDRAGARAGFSWALGLPADVGPLAGARGARGDALRAGARVRGVPLVARVEAVPGGRAGGGGDGAAGAVVRPRGGGGRHPHAGGCLGGRDGGTAVGDARAARAAGGGSGVSAVFYGGA